MTISNNLPPLSSVVAIYKGQQKQKPTRTTSVVLKPRELGRRAILAPFMLAISATSMPQVDDSRTTLLQKYLKQSEANKAKNDKDRLDSYYKRNYKDYFGFVEGSLSGKEDQLSEAEKGILDWLKANKD
ncbi:hypothetical protein GIB67_032579 [Kingdonia uniflora]|uniref:Photosystem I reaction center subunit N n=1 Tax=Kingdonia uniflora TaxID=39325 RepID=A0A7J7LS24_9MAGN|nr:hypothetical protein GIB67_032579 [Kingdonia uniflora]